eukprot:CAMPEP_0182796816 /NCGR_PEP_ID=MMETSP0006_2-20121128/477_1 /TAXON_ID=97485 /ORGANISM="Prymnesium parvum, Strain Texoma1" /LENGTH=75 /DNA_ID=CAMNT_0024921809 /DNA_START=154 /DNA_END=378 /DNA_ORIENTATION=+
MTLACVSVDAHMRGGQQQVIIPTNELAPVDDATRRRRIRRRGATAPVARGAPTPSATLACASVDARMRGAQNGGN